MGDIDVPWVGQPDRDELYEVLAEAERHLGMPVQAAARGADWLASGAGAFHQTVTSRPTLKLAVDVKRSGPEVK